MGTNSSDQAGPGPNNSKQPAATLPVGDLTRDFTPSYADEQPTAEFVVKTSPVSSGDPDGTLEFASGGPLDVYAVHEGGTRSSSEDRQQVRSASHQFRTIRKHAKGGLGQVLLAHDETLCRDVAVKEIRDEHAGNRESQSRFVMEARVTAALQHPSIVPVYVIGNYSDGRPFYAMRFIDGDSMEDVAKRFHERRSKLEPGQAAVELRKLIGSFIDVCHAIEYAHSRGILHRDIKPANIMLGKYGETLVVDWGIAKLMNEWSSDSGVGEGSVRLPAEGNTEATLEGTAKGTMQYMSPEQARGEVDLIGPATDIYSLGATLYYILTGKGRFGGRMTFGELLAKLKNGDFLSPRQVDRSISAPLDAICLKAMAPSRLDRYRSAQALASDLERWLADEPVTAYRESRWEQALRWLRHHRTWAQAGLAMLISVTLVSVVAAVLINQARQRERIALNRERLARQAEARQRALAEENFRHALTVVETFFTQVAESTLLNVPGAQSIRQELLQLALDYYLRFLEQRGDNPSLKEEVAAAAFRAGMATWVIKSSEEAMPYYDRARRMQEELLRTASDNNDRRYALSNTYNEIGRLRYHAAQYAEAHDWFRKSHDERAKLVARDKDNLEYQRKLASSKNNLGVIAQKSGDHVEAMTLYSQAIEIGSRLVERDAKHELYRRDLARNRYNLGTLALEGGEIALALENLPLAAEEFQRLAHDFHLITEYGQQAGQCFQLLGDMQLRAAQFDEAVAWLEKARKIQLSLSWRNPEQVDLTVDLAVTCSHLARWCQQRDDLTVALEWTAEVTRLLSPLVASERQVARSYRDLATNLARTGSLELASENDAAALPAFEESLRLYGILETKILQNDSATESQRFELSAEIAACLTDKGLVENRQGNFDQARQTLEAARARYEAIIANASLSAGGAAALQDGLARCYANLGQIEQASGELAAAQSSFERARQIHEAHLADVSTGTLHRLHLAETLMLIAQAQTQQQQHDEALRTYHTASDTLRVAIEEANQLPQPLRISAAAAHQRGAILHAQERDQDALAAYQQAVVQQQRAFELAGRATRYRQVLDTYLGDLALVQSSSGLTSDAADTMLKRRNLWGDDPEKLFRIAVDFALVALRDPADLSDSEKMDQVMYTDSVISLLREARAAGFSDWDAAAKAPAFERLADEPRFRQIITEGN